MEYRVERDSMGEMKVPADVYWGAQTQRSYENFRIGSEKMPPELIRALGMLKKAAAMANYNLGKLDLRRRDVMNWRKDGWTGIFRFRSGRREAGPRPI